MIHWEWITHNRESALCCVPPVRILGRICLRTGRPGHLRKRKCTPAEWKQRLTRRHSFLFALFLAIDANFRLKRKDVSTEEKDPGLGQGWAFFCEVGKYMAHVKANWGQVQEVRERRIRGSKN